MTELSDRLRAQFGEPIVSEPPVDPYEPNPFKRRARDNALRHQAEDIRRWKQIGGVPNATSQTDSDGDNDI